MSRASLLLRAAVPLLLPVLLLAGCQGVDYDIEEVASDEWLGLDEHHHHEDGEPCEACEEEEDHDHGEGGTGATFVNPYPRYDGTFLCVSPEAPDELLGDPESSGLHVHGAGERNHGTGWFFNQPWAATFIWPKMIRDTVILVILAAVVLLASRRLSGGRGR